MSKADRSRIGTTFADPDETAFPDPPKSSISQSEIQDDYSYIGKQSAYLNNKCDCENPHGSHNNPNMKTNGFLNPVEIRNLITANTDENAPHFVFMTVHGTVFGHDPSNPPTTVRKFGAFAGTTWLRHAKAIAETGAASTEPDFGLNGTTLKVVISRDGRRLHHMVVRVDDMVSAVYMVKEKTLLAAQMERSGFVGEGDEGMGDQGVSNQAEISTKGERAALTDGEGEAQDHKNAASDEQSDHNSESSNQQTTTTSSPPNPNPQPQLQQPQPQPQLSKLRILELRAEAMAEAFRDEICGPNFKMPAEFR